VLRLRDRLYEAAGFEAGIGDRIWVERGSDARNGRAVVNMEEVYSCIQQHGFVSVDFGNHTLQKQIAVDRDIDVMLGSHGSAFVHCGFMATRREVIEIFSPHHVNPSVIQLCIAMNHQYTQMVPVHTARAPYKRDTNIMVDMDHLTLALSFLRPRRRRRSGS
jgi:capsular polysaccharide biosynthesis protein